MADITQPPSEEKRKGFFSSPYVLGGAALLPALLAFAKARRVNVKGMTSPQKALAARIRSKGLTRDVPDEDLFKTPILKDVLHYLQYGTKDIIPNSRSLNAVKKLNTGAIYAPDRIGAPTTASGIPVIGRGVRYGDLENKALEAKIYNKHAPSAMAKTIQFNALPSRVLRGAPTDKLDAIQAFLKKKYPKGYIIKGTHDARSEGTLLTDKDNLSSIYSQFKSLRSGGTVPGTPYTMRQIKSLERTNPDAFATLMMTTPNLRGSFHINDMLRNPQKIIAQRRFQLERLGAADQLVNKIFRRTVPNSAEVRVHTIGDRVLPISLKKFGPVSQTLGVLGSRPKAVVEAENAAGRYLKKLPKNYVQNRQFALDVAKTPQGYKIIEGNPSGLSGHLHPIHSRLSAPQAIMSHRFVSALQGRDTVPLALAKALGAGTAGGGLAYTAKKLTEDDSPQNA